MSDVDPVVVFWQHMATGCVTCMSEELAASICQVDVTMGIKYTFCMVSNWLRDHRRHYTMPSDICPTVALQMAFYCPFAIPWPCSGVRLFFRFSSVRLHTKPEQFLCLLTWTLKTEVESFS
jgi:hypothetical protein